MNMAERNIRLWPETYDRLELYRLKRETFDQAVARLMNEHSDITLRINQFTHSPEYKAWEAAHLDAKR